MSNRLHKSWTVLQSLESIEGDRCVDIFERPDQSFGFEEFRRDAEDMGHWTAVGYYSSLNFNNKEVTLRQARRYVPWLAAL